MTWFESWFDSSYYHILYKNRDDNEAKLFIEKLAKHLNVSKNHKILDLACGKGRHSIFLNSLGFDVLGVDLSENSIAYAKQYENEKLRFQTHDMREVVAEGEFDFVLNLFTSFGYFEIDADNEKTISAIASDLKPAGTVVIDFFNAYKVVNHLVAYDRKTIDGITFEIRKRFENGYILKNISFSDQGKDFAFIEKVQALTLDQFQQLLSNAGLAIRNTFGNYLLDNYQKESSDRLILVAEKI